MTFIDTVKGLTMKQPAQSADPRRGPVMEMKSRPRRGEVENPYLAARRTWNEHVGSVVSSRQTWQVVGILSLLIALSAVGGMIHIGSQSKFVPYVVEVDKLGQAVAGSLAESIEYSRNTALRCRATSGVTRRISLMNEATEACTTR